MHQPKKKKPAAVPAEYAAQRRKAVMWLVAFLVVLGAALFAYATPRLIERVQGVITDQYALPGRSGAASFCRVSVPNRGTVLAACGALRRLPQEVTVEINESYLFGAGLNRVVTPVVSP